MGLSPVVNLVGEEVHQHVPRRVALHEGRTLHRDFGVQRGVVGGVAPADQPCVRGLLRCRQLRHPVKWSLAGKGLAHVRFAIKRSDVIPVDDQDVIERRPQAGEEARARGGELGIAELKAGRVQTVVGKPSGGPRQKSKLCKLAHRAGISLNAGLSTTAADPGPDGRELGEVEAAFVGTVRVDEERQVSEAQPTADEVVPRRQMLLHHAERALSSSQQIRQTRIISFPLEHSDEARDRDGRLVVVLLEEHPLQHLCAAESVVRDQPRAFAEVPEDRT